MLAGISTGFKLANGDFRRPYRELMPLVLPPFASLHAPTERKDVLPFVPKGRNDIRFEIDGELFHGRRLCQSVSRSYIRADRNSRSSSKGGASSCRPIGRLSELKPAGIEMPGNPARLALIV
jgi:hypothetical protein